MRRMQWIATVLATFCAASALAARSDPPGTTYASQKLVYKDSVTGHTVWRMTVDGTRDGVLNNIRDASGMENNSFSPQNDRICYSKFGHPDKPDGIYMMDIESGEETYLAPVGGRNRGVCAWSRTSNEIFYHREVSGNVELRAVDLANHSTRLLKTFKDTTTLNTSISLNNDGSYLVSMVSHPPNREINFTILRPDGTEHPKWAFDTADTPDQIGAGSHPYWSPIDSKVIRIHRQGAFGIYDIDTAATISATPQIIGDPATMPPGHACWTADGKILFRSWGHADCHPLQKGLGDQTDVVIDGNGNRPFVYLTQMRNADSRTAWPPDGDRLAVHYNYSPSTVNEGHSHPHFSRDARYVLYASDMTLLPDGVAAPPGGVDHDPLSVDLFIIPLGASSTGKKPQPPSDVSVQ